MTRLFYCTYVYVATEGGINSRSESTNNIQAKNNVKSHILHWYVTKSHNYNSPWHNKGMIMNKIIISYCLYLQSIDQGVFTNNSIIGLDINKVSPDPESYSLFPYFCIRD